MGLRIEAVATSLPQKGGALELLIPFVRRHRHKSALLLADLAARACLNKTKHEASEIALLINVGIYRDKNLGEPALAALIQEDIGANSGISASEHPNSTHPHKHGTFSFDLANGACGVVNALHVMNGFIESGRLALGMIVASENNPSPRKWPVFPHPSAGGAMLLSKGEENEGFMGFYFENFPEFEYMHEARISWHPRRFYLPFTQQGENYLQIKEAPAYITRCVECVEIALARFLKQQHLSLMDIDLIICSQYPPEFPDKLEHLLKLPSDRFARVHESFMGALTVAPLASIEAAQRNGCYQKAQRILFMTVTAGISVALALYQKPESEAGEFLKQLNQTR